ncbi:hypothetical protein N7474_006904 [Penicillium riverlandense]|uniref:uncharacterized protein n=1 Tax=Penicillium riverlandense TaxID=1903569 RepID=UPI002548FA0F|nr:uncharacterized protein N7474_006904 [Penicillium riverlandense]KAJ5815127.1 hypothetical protein N7474_006904 [Penicillium riverlandense]
MTHESMIPGDLSGPRYDLFALSPEPARVLSDSSAYSLTVPSPTQTSTSGHTQQVVEDPSSSLSLGHVSEDPTGSPIHIEPTHNEIAHFQGLPYYSEPSLDGLVQDYPLQMYGVFEPQHDTFSRDSQTSNFPNLNAPTVQDMAASLTTLCSPRLAVSMPDPIHRPYTWPMSSQDTWNCTVTDYNYAQHAFRSSTGGAQEASPPAGSSLHVIFEDPRENPRGHRERRIRSKIDVEKQKENTRLLKMFGGACLWCYRSKKRCQPADTCRSCVLNLRKCIRESSQLSLFGPTVELSADDGLAAFLLSPPSREALTTLGFLSNKILKREPGLRVVINLRQTGDGQIQTWAIDLREAQTAVSSAWGHPAAGFIAEAHKYVWCAELVKLEKAYHLHPLVQSAIAMARMFMTLRCLGQTNVHVSHFDIDIARLTLFYVLVVCSRDLAEKSERFAGILCEILRGKDLHHESGSGKEEETYAVSPIWAATALYYRVVSGLLDLHTCLSIAPIFNSFASHLDGVHSSLWSILKWISPSQEPCSKDSLTAVLNDEIPVLPSREYFDIALWLGPSSLEPFEPVVFRRHADPFSETSHAMESFLDEAFTRPPVHLRPSPDNPASPRKAKPAETNMPDDASANKPPRMISPVRSEDFDPTNPDTWPSHEESMTLIDEFFGATTPKPETSSATIPTKTVFR